MNYGRSLGPSRPLSHSDNRFSENYLVKTAQACTIVAIGKPKWKSWLSDGENRRQ